MTRSGRFQWLFLLGISGMLAYGLACEPSSESTPVPSATPTPPAAILPTATPAEPPAPLPNPTSTATAVPSPRTTVQVPSGVVGQTLTFGNQPLPATLDIYALARQLLPDADLTPPTYERDEVGDARSFFTYNLAERSRSPLDTRLCLSTENADFYVQVRINLTCAAFDSNVARRYEEIIRPAVISGFAGDPSLAEHLRVALVHADLTGFGGYFDATDLYPRGINPYASGRYTLYLNAARNRPGDPRHSYYDSLVAHELQHALHELSDPDESTWVNEGLSVLAEDINPTGEGSDYFLKSCPPTQVIIWPPLASAASCHYAGAGLIMRYLRDNYPDENGSLQMLTAEPANGLQGIDSYLTGVRADVDVLELLADWGAANYLDGRSNHDSYHNFDAEARITRLLPESGELSHFFTQFAADYIALPIDADSYTIEFNGDTVVPLLPGLEEMSGSFWHAGGEDAATYALTREFDLRNTGEDEEALLTLLLRHDIEEDWDYLYATVSTDFGKTWQVIRTPSMKDTPKTAVGGTFGPGFTGKSGNGALPQWVLEEFDLASFRGQRIWFRLLYVTDQSINMDGVSLAGAWLPSVNYGWIAIDESIPVPLAAQTTGPQHEGGWTPQGFFFSNNLVKQDYAIRLLTVSVDGSGAVTAMPIDATGHGMVIFDNSTGDITDAALMVMPQSPRTRQPTHATITVREVQDSG